MFTSIYDKLNKRSKLAFLFKLIRINYDVTKDFYCQVQVSRFITSLHILNLKIVETFRTYFQKKKTRSLLPKFINCQVTKESKNYNINT